MTVRLDAESQPTLLAALDSAVLRVQLDGEKRTCCANARFLDLLGLSAHEFKGVDFLALLSRSHGNFFVEQIAEALAEKEYWRGEITLFSRSAFCIWIE